MKRTLILTITLLLTALLATGCGTDSLVAYKNAVDKTDQITKGQCSAEFTLAMDFNTEGMTPEDIKEMNYYKNMTGSFQAAFDDESEQGIFRNYLNLGGLGFDFDLFYDEDEMFAKLPVVGKYMRIDEMIKEIKGQQDPEAQDPETQDQFLSKDTLDEISAEWIGLLKREDVFKGKDIVLTTPDGEVKTTVYTITLRDEQVKTMASNAIEVLSKDETLKANVTSLMAQNMEQPKENFYEEFFSNMEEHLRENQVENFNYTAYVDIDGYIVNEMIEFIITSETTEQGCPTEINYKLEMNNWDINKEQKFDFPVLNEENTVKMDEMDDSIPSVMKDLFQTQD